MSRFDHFHHEGGSAASQVVIGADASENGHNGAARGQARFVPEGVSGGAVRLDESSDFVETPDDETLSGMQALSVACWFNVDSFAPRFEEAGHLVNKALQGDDSTSTDTFAFGVAGIGAAAQLGASVSSGDSKATPNVLMQLETGVWYHAAFTYDGSTVRVYLDGKQKASESYAGVLNTTSAPLLIGAVGGPGNSGFDGLIDEVMVFDRALSAGEVAQLAVRNPRAN